MRTSWQVTAPLNRPTSQRQERRAAMPALTQVWDEFVAEFGMPAAFHGVEKSNGLTIEWPKGEGDEPVRR